MVANQLSPTVPAPLAPPPGRWAVLAAKAAALTALPSGIWRIVMGIGIPVGFDTSNLAVPGWFSVLCIAMSLATEGLALLTLGLVQPWGEVVPAWIPLIGGKRVAPLAAVVPALLGAAALMWLTIPRAGGFGAAEGAPSGLPLVVMDACYAPLLLWGPLLAVVTVAYYRRRRG
ncbi:hypothetical protein HUT16_27955 [Kitasatospora sp. NA04385]|uniref:hypothetical protein n=1 Tax=Kitasatospora sp. NA04385 TaxID=2742135 RepID=UPI0011636CF5|nr:hypothetical protein [Kitasatospora sp. NA04385]QDJ74272.1 hypothetical protein [Kitasatospora sp.]QKW22405.1 hypothetical protein HUT16_27955 [Kitasatospora sp. NA04385]